MATFSAPGLQGLRVGVVTSGGNGATPAIVGVRRAFEEAGIEPVAISAASTSVLFASLWACGLTADEIATFWLEIPVSDCIDARFSGVMKGALASVRGRARVLDGEAVERAFLRRIGPRTLGKTRIPFAVAAWNVGENRVEYLSSTLTPELTVARVARVALAAPPLAEPVPIGASFYADGGMVDVFPTAPLAEVEPVDLVVGTNAYGPAPFDGTSSGVGSGGARPVFRASPGLGEEAVLQLAREHAASLGQRLELLHLLEHDGRGATLDESLLDRRAWPEHMRRGHVAARAALQRRAGVWHAERHRGPAWSSRPRDVGPKRDGDAAGKAA